HGASLMLISGGRGLYHRLGYVEVGRFVVYRAPAGPLPVGLQIRKMEAADLDALIALHQREPVRFIRPREDWVAPPDAGMLMNEPAEIRVVEHTGQAVHGAYLGVRAVGDGSPPAVLEFAGSR